MHTYKLCTFIYSIFPKNKNKSSHPKLKQNIKRINFAASGVSMLQPKPSFQISKHHANLLIIIIIIYNIYTFISILLINNIISSEFNLLLLDEHFILVKFI